MSTATDIIPEALRKHAKALQEISDKMEAAGNPDWFPIAQATVVLDSLSLGLAQIKTATPSNWIADAARTVRSKEYA